MPRSLFNGAGYFKNDDRCSGGLLVEDDILACSHCQAALKRREWDRQGGWKCHQCDQPLCQHCGSAPPSLKCVGPYEAQLERKLADHYRKVQNAKLLGI